MKTQKLNEESSYEELDLQLEPSTYSLLAWVYFSLILEIAYIYKNIAG